MKRIISISVILLSTLALYAQDAVFFKHELKASFGDPLNVNQEWKTHYAGNLSISYSYRCLKWLWFGVNVVNYIGNTKYYYAREYDAENNYSDYHYKTKDIGFGLLPEVRFSYCNKKQTILYSGIAIGYSVIKNHPNGLSNIKGMRMAQATYFGCSFYFGKNQNFFMGSEIGVGVRGIINGHAGYRF